MKQVSLSEQAYECIKQEIVSLKLPPGSVINEAGLKEELGFGRTPIREALKRLSLERLVVIAPRRGIFVAEIGIRDLQQLFEMRLPLESLAARLAAERGADRHWDRMKSALSALDGTADNNQALITIDKTCHEIIYDAADNEFLRDTLVTHYALSLRLWYYFLSRIGDMREALREHQLILEALQAKDGHRAARLMERHIGTFQEEIQSVMFSSAVPTGALDPDIVIT
ncbi:MAG TPA: GntR family transcriptional regulator [Anaerolineae bacterium]|nr:GntR family transcriptional regulator [Anaerolineae bacterium]